MDKEKKPILFEFYKYLSRLIRKVELIGHVKIEKEGYDNFVFEKIGDKEYSIAHTYIQNGDVMYEPEITFKTTDTNKIIILTYTQHSLGIHEKYIGIKNKEKLVDIYDFFKQWLINLKNQEFITIEGKEYQGEEDFETFIGLEEKVDISKEFDKLIDERKLIIRENLLQVLNLDNRQKQNILSLVENKKRNNLNEYTDFIFIKDEMVRIEIKIDGDIIQIRRKE